MASPSPIMLGKIAVPVPGTPVQLSTLLVGVQRNFLAYHAALLQALPSNSGKIYIGDAQLNKSTFAHCGVVLAVPTANAIPSFGVANVLSPAGIDLSSIWIDADVAGEGILVSILET